MTDNGPVYASYAWREHGDELGLRHLRTRPYTPRTNSKAERFIQMLLPSWAYAFAYPSSAHRTRALGVRQHLLACEADKRGLLGAHR